MSAPLQNDSAQGRTPRLLILAARRSDYETTVSQFDFEKKLHQNHPYYYKGTPSSDTRITHVGMGPRQTTQTISKLKGLLDPDFLIIVGSAGALKDDISQNDIFIPTAVAGNEQQKWNYPPSEFLRWIMGVLQDNGEFESTTLRSGPMITSQEPVVNPKKRRSLNDQSGALAVDMETSTIVENLINSREDPPQWCSLRVISDTVHDDSLEAVKANQSEASNKMGNLLSLLLTEFI